MAYVKNGSIIRKKNTSEPIESKPPESVPPPYSFTGRGYTLGGNMSHGSFFENMEKQETKKLPSKSGLLAIEAKKAAEQKMKSNGPVQKNNDEWDKILKDPDFSSAGRSVEAEKQFQIGLYTGLSSSSSSRHSR